MKDQIAAHHPGRARNRERLIKGFCLAILATWGAVLVVNFLNWAADAAFVVQYPYQFSYGEGIVWQQAVMILRGEGYSDITRLPFVVFHYPPVYHLLAGLFAGVLNIEYLAAGRIVSGLSTLGAAIIIGMLIFRAVREREGLMPSLLCALGAGLIVFTFNPIAGWSHLMRVDMAAIFLSFLGIYFGLQAPERPRYVYVSALFFLLAMFTKQTAVAAPLATLLVLMIIRPRLAGIGFITALGLGLLTIVSLQLTTDGGFLEHIIFHNINRVDFSRLMIIISYIARYSIYFVIVAYCLIISINSLTRVCPKFSWIETLRQKLSSDRHDRLQCFCVIYFFLTTLTLISIVKIGSDINYLSEWMFVWSIAIGLILRRPIGFALDYIIWSKGREPAHNISRLSLLFSLDKFPLLFAALLIQALLVQLIHSLEYRSVIANVALQEQQKELLRRVQEASKPVISDDMVAIMNSGKEVVWEAAIFAELATLDRWDEGPFIQMIRSNDFAFFVTEGEKGDPVFDRRYTASVLAAIESAYPRTEQLAGYTIHLPPE